VLAAVVTALEADDDDREEMLAVAGWRSHFVLVSTTERGRNSLA
jgi:hypothetical protein